MKICHLLSCRFLPVLSCYDRVRIIIMVLFLLATSGSALYSQRETVNPSISVYYPKSDTTEISQDDSIKIYYQGGFETDTIDLYINDERFSSHAVRYSALSGRSMLVTTLPNSYNTSFKFGVFFRNSNLLVKPVYLEQITRLTIIANTTTTLLELEDADADIYDSKFVEVEWPASCSYHIHSSLPSHEKSQSNFIDSFFSIYSNLFRRK